MNSYEFQRYQRQIIMDEVGFDGQAKLFQARVAIIGAGGLGCPVATYLCAAGIGNLTMIDDDVVSLSNLQRQVLYTEQDIGQPKVICMQKRLEVQQITANIQAIQTRLTIENALQLLDNHDVIVDCSDNIETRLLLNDVSKKLNMPWIFGSVLQFEGQVAVFNYQNSGNFLDLFPEINNSIVHQSCEEAGVMGVLPSIIGSMQASETIKILLNIGDLLINKILIINVLNWKMRILKYKK